MPRYQTSLPRARVRPVLALVLIRLGPGGQPGQKQERPPQGPQEGVCAPNPAGSAQNSSLGVGRGQHRPGQKPQRPRLLVGMARRTLWSGRGPSSDPACLWCGTQARQTAPGPWGWEARCGCAHSPLGTGWLPQRLSTVAASGRARPSEVTGVLGRALGREGGAWHTPCF